MTTPPFPDDLERELSAAETEVIERIEEVCDEEPEELPGKDTGELLRLEKALDAAHAAVERAVELRKVRRAREAEPEAPNVREFRDASAREWRVWSVTPSPRGGKQDALLQFGPDFQHGWLAFESLDGSERRRLPNPGANPLAKSDDDLVKMLERALPAPTRRKRAD